SCEPLVMAHQVHVHIVYETGDAAGQNMTTAATWHVCQRLQELGRTEPALRFDRFFIEGNGSTDNKVSFRSFLTGRGMRVVAECFIPRTVLQRVLKTSPEELQEIIGIARDGAIASGALGFNVNVSNMVAAMFAATGQDIACVHESSVAHLQT